MIEDEETHRVYPIYRDGSPVGWIHEDEKNRMESSYDKVERDIIALVMYPEYVEKHNNRKTLNEDNRKWAMIKVGNTQLLAWVDNKTMIAYKADGYSSTWIQWKTYTFIRWATSFDL